MDDSTKRHIDFIASQRDEHIARFHSVNGQFALGLLAFGAAVLFGVASAADAISKLAGSGTPSRLCLIASAATILASAVLIGLALVRHSNARNDRVKVLEQQILSLYQPDEHDPPARPDLERALSSWVNPGRFNQLVFFASTLLVGGVVLGGLAIVLAR